MEPMKNFIDGRWNKAECSAYLDVTNPSTGEVIGKVPLSSERELELAVRSAKQAFKEWSAAAVSSRTAYLFKLHRLLEEHTGELVQSVMEEGGKTLVDAQAEIKRAIQNVEVACAMPMLMKGEKLEGIASGIDGEMIKQPVGVFGIIPPYNFPAMVPFWFLPYAIASGNTVVIKPSEQVPVTMSKIFELIEKLELPKGVVNLVNGDKKIAEAMVNHPDISGISFVGSSKVASIIAEACARTGKRFQALGSAKNFLLVLEDADIDKTVDSLVTSCYGCAGQRCMAASVIAAVPEVIGPLTEKFIAEAKKLKTGSALDPSVDVGPVISKASKERILNLIETGAREGAELILDGRGVAMSDELKNGYYIGPTIFQNTTADMAIMNEEIFGPVASIIEIKDLDEGLRLIQNCRYGNGASIFTKSGYYARRFQSEVSAGMVGINIGIPAPVAYFPFGGQKQSMYGDIKAQGSEVVNFFTDKKIITSRFF